MDDKRLLEAFLETITDIQECVLKEDMAKEETLLYDSLEKLAFTIRSYLI